MTTTPAFTLHLRTDRVAGLTVDVPDEKMNTLKAGFAGQVRALLKQIRENRGIRGLVIISAKADNFIAGADIRMIDGCASITSCAAAALFTALRVASSS